MLKLQIEKYFQNAINWVLVKLAIKFELQQKNYWKPRFILLYKILNMLKLCFYTLTVFKNITYILT